jgi:hypothetical protein
LCTITTGTDPNPAAGTHASMNTSRIKISAVSRLRHNTPLQTALTRGNKQKQENMIAKRPKKKNPKIMQENKKLKIERTKKVL